MKKFISNICSIALGLLASVMAFLPMFNYFSVAGDTKTVFEESSFGLFEKIADEYIILFEGLDSTYNNVFKIISAVVVGLAIACVAIFIILTIVEFFNKKANYSNIKKLVGIILLGLAILFVVSTCIYFIVNNVAGEAKITKVFFQRGFQVGNWFTYLSVILGFAGAGAFAMVQEKKKSKKKK